MRTEKGAQSAASTYVVDNIIINSILLASIIDDINRKNS